MVSGVCTAHRQTSDVVLFSYVGYYMLVYLQDHFLHCINTRQEEMLCHSLFLSGKTRLLYESCLSSWWQFVVFSLFLSYGTCSYFFSICFYFISKREPCIFWHFHTFWHICPSWCLFSEKEGGPIINPFLIHVLFSVCATPKVMMRTWACSVSRLTSLVLHTEEEPCGSLLDVASGRIYSAELSPAFLLQILRSHASSRWVSWK